MPVRTKASTCIHVCVCVCVSLSEYRYPLKPEEVIRHPGNGLKGCWELTDIGSGIVSSSSVFFNFFLWRLKVFIVKILYLIGEIYSRIFVEAIVEWGCLLISFLLCLSLAYSMASGFCVR